MSTRTASAACLAPVTVIDADGDDFALDFGFPEVSTARPAAAKPEIDKVQARLAHDARGAEFRREWYQDKGILPR